MLHFVTRLDVKTLKKLVPAFQDVLLNATPFKGDLLGSYESPTISTIPARMDQHRQYKSVHEVQFIPKIYRKNVSQ